MLDFRTNKTAKMDLHEIKNMKTANRSKPAHHGTSLSDDKKTKKSAKNLRFLTGNPAMDSHKRRLPHTGTLRSKR